MHRLEALEVRQASRLRPAEEVCDGADVGKTRVAVADVGGEELDEAAGRQLPCRGDRRRDRGLVAGDDERVGHASSVAESAQKFNNIKDVMLLNPGAEGRGRTEGL